MALLKQSTTYTRTFLMIASSDHLSPLTGASPTVNISKAGGAFGAAAGTVTEIANGFYKIALTTADTGTVGDLAFHITAASGDNTDFVDQVSVTILSDISTDGSGNVSITSNVKKNAASRLIFVMTDSTTHNPKTGVTVTSQRSIDGGALASTANSVTEISNGLYTLVLAAADTNGNDINYRLTGSGADDLNIEFVTQP